MGLNGAIYPVIFPRGKPSMATFAVGQVRGLGTNQCSFSAASPGQ